MKERLRRIRQEILGVLSILGGLYVTLSLVTYSRWDVSLFVYTTQPTQNWGGVVGSYLADFLVSSAGIAACIFPLALLLYGIKRLLGKEGHWVYLLGTILFIISSSLSAALIASTFRFASPLSAGGIAGAMLSDFL